VTQISRISFVLPFYTPTPIGGYRVVYEYADFLAARGHAVTIIYPRHYSPPPTPAPFNFLRRHLWAPRTRLRNRPLIPWHTLHPRVRLALVPDLQEASVPDGDVIIATFWATAPPVAELSAAKGRKFYLIQHHETWAGPEIEVNDTWHLPFKKIVISKWLEEIGSQLGASGMRHIPNGIDLKRFRITTPPNKRPMSILSLYHDQVFKGVPDALAVLELYHERFPEVPISMFGTLPRGPDMPTWIRYFHNLSQEDLVQQAYNCNAIYFGASLIEGWALPPAEAMACGCAFVGTDSGGCRDFAIHNRTALLSAAGDRQGMLHNLSAMTKDNGLLRRIQLAGTEYIQQFTWKRAGAAFEEYLST